MSDFGHVEKITREVGGRVITFRSKGEYRWCVWCELRREQGIITDWLYESEECPVKTKLGEIKIYRPDFTIQDGPEYSFEEFKGWFTSKDYTKMKLFAEQYDNPLTLIFANLTNCKSARVQYGRAKRLEKLLESNGGRVIYDARATIFKPIQHLFEV
jgi:hypothetical protein